MLGLGAIAAAGLATLANKSSFGWPSRFWVTHAAPPSTRHGTGFLHRSLATVHGLFSPTSIFGNTDDSAMASLTPPQPPPTWTHTPEDVKRITKELIEKDKQLTDKIAALAPEECNFETVRRT